MKNADSRVVSRQWLGCLVATMVLASSAYVKAEGLCARHARSLLEAVNKSDGVALHVDQSLEHPEAFVIEKEDTQIVIRGGGSAGLLYGVQAFLCEGIPEERTRRIAMMQQPDFRFRGAVLFLQKDGTYDHPLTSEEFPWFYDRALLTKFLDQLFESRFNTLVLWTGNLFPSIVELTEYPDATDLSKEQLRGNQAQMKWLTHECAKRNIRVLLHFYNIHIPRSLARSRGISHVHQRPNPFVTRYVRYTLDRFLEEFEGVGFYVCPGEALRPEYQVDWFRDVILASAKASGKDPFVVLRGWTTGDRKGFREQFIRKCKGAYANLYSDLKHNNENLGSPIPDPRHEYFLGMANGHIANLCELADLKPFRWASHPFIHEMTRNWHAKGFDGALIFGMVSWRWPYTLDKIEPRQEGLWPDGKKLLTIERDAIWLAMAGRYLWKVDRPVDAEKQYWTNWLSRRFGNIESGRLLYDWYTVTGSILPGLFNLTSVANMNWYCTAIGSEQYLDNIILSRDQHALFRRDPNQDRDARAMDSLFFARYRAEYGMSELTGRIPMSVATYADRCAVGESVDEAMTPDNVVDLLVAMAEQGLTLARQAAACATENRAEAARFVTDSLALVYVVKTWRSKIKAAIHRRLWDRTGDPKHQAVVLRHMNEGIAVYEKLVALTDRTYVNPTDMQMRINWHIGLDHFKADRAYQAIYPKIAEAKKDPGILWIETENMDGHWRVRLDWPGYYGHGYSDTPTSTARTPSKWEGTPLRTKVKVKRPGRYTVWTRGVICGTPEMGFAVEVDGTKLPPTHGEPGLRIPGYAVEVRGQAKQPQTRIEAPPGVDFFVWRKAGTVSLPVGTAEILLHDAGEEFGCPDVIVLSHYPGWSPPLAK